jgi:hypothetical protein
MPNPNDFNPLRWAHDWPLDHPWWALGILLVVFIVMIVKTYADRDL